MGTCARGDGRRAFSLVELITVIGIIAILIAMLLPALSKARERARTLQCLSQLRGMGQGLFNYAIAYRGSFPSISDWQVYGGDGTGEDHQGPGWTEELEPYYAKALSGVYWCPSFPRETQFNYFLSSNWAGLHGRPSLLQSDIKKSSQFILGAECTHQGSYSAPWGDGPYEFTDCDKDDLGQKQLVWAGEEHGFTAHRAGNNVLFGDGHVECCRKFDPSHMTYNPHVEGQDWGEVTPGE
jgi:prepilin-type N-terminal cleavage/methylation domain-containing protein/prepilin-type processing-associated H-X9-DG protein